MLAHVGVPSSTTCMGLSGAGFTCPWPSTVQRDSLCREVHSQVVAALTLEEPYLYGLAVTRGEACGTHAEALTHMHTHPHTPTRYTHLHPHPHPPTQQSSSAAAGSEEYFLELQKKLSKYAPKAWSKMEAPPPGARAPHEQPPEFIVKFRVQYYLDRDMFKKWVGQVVGTMQGTL